MARILAKAVKRITFSIKVETNDPEHEPVKAGLTVEVSDEMKMSKLQFMETIKQTNQSFEDLFEDEVE
jgi:hypothetical protein